MQHSSVALAVISSVIAFTYSDEILERRIVGGHQTNESNCPYFAVIWTSKGVRCGGALIAPGWILTAAHCFRNGGKKVDPATELEVAVGIDDIRNFGREKVRHVGLYGHPDFSLDHVLNDILLIRLGVNLTAKGAVDHVELPQVEEEKKYTEKKDAVEIVGFGLTQFDGEPSNFLMAVSVTIFNDSKCNQFRKFNSDVQICAGSADGKKDACLGDSGGPLVAGDKPVILGIVSWGIDCGKPGKPGVYTKVSHFLPWINSIISSH